jgi:hypothetical protein
MRDTSYDDRRVSIERTRRPDNWVVNVIKNSGMSPDTCALYIELSDLPQRFEINQKYVVRTGRYGAEKRVRRMFAEMVAAGRAEISPIRDAEGKFLHGIYRLRGCGAVDNASAPGATKNEGNAEICGRDGTERRAVNRRPVIDNSIDNPRITTCAETVENAQTSDQTEAERPQAVAKAPVTEKGKAERPMSAAKGCLPANERRSRAANGSPVKERDEKSSDKPAYVRIAEQARALLIAAGGDALADPRRTPGLSNLQQVIAWLAAGFDMRLDIIPTIAAVSGRATMQPRQVRSWKYYDAPICAAHAERCGLDLPKAPPRRGPRLDPYMPPPRDPDDGSAWQQINLAARLLGQRRV